MAQRINNIVESFTNSSKEAIKPLVFDSSDYLSENQTGYSELSGWLNHYNVQLMSTVPRLSVCLYLYTWANNCQHCHFDHDLSVIKESIDDIYKKVAENPTYKKVSFKNTLQSYNIAKNQLPPLQKEQLQDLTKISG